MLEDINFDPFDPDSMEPEHPWIGVSVSVSNRPSIGHVLAEKPLSGPVVVKVALDGPAHKAGIKSGDMIVQFDHLPVNSPESFIEGLNKRQIGEVIILGISRDDHILQLKVLVARDPDYQRHLNEPNSATF